MMTWLQVGKPFVVVNTVCNSVFVVGTSKRTLLRTVAATGLDRGRRLE